MDNWLRRAGKIALLFFAVIATGVIGFMLIEGWGLLDALFMTVVTVSTVGYSEVHPLSSGGMAFAIILICFGVGTFLYAIMSIGEFIVRGAWTGTLGRRRMKKMIDAMKNHYILCGFGRVGQQVAVELDKEGVSFVVVDSNAEAVGVCAGAGHVFVEGDASNDEVLKDAGIERAKGLITATDSDADNVYITLSARGLKADLFIVARANTEKSEYKLLKAGADRVLSPYSLGGRRLASLVLRPMVVEFLDVVMHSPDVELFMEEVEVGGSSAFVGATITDIKERCAAGANILALKKRGEDRVAASPPPDTTIGEGDMFVALGTRAQLKELEGLS